ALVQKKLAACVNIIPNVVSVYEWKNEIQTDSEVLMVIKSRTLRLDEMTTFVRRFVRGGSLLTSESPKQFWVILDTFSDEVLCTTFFLSQSPLVHFGHRAMTSVAAPSNISPGTFSVSYVTAPDQQVAKKLA
ncbi:protein CutA homolog isoform X3, partial [Ixodes scapularis]